MMNIKSWMLILMLGISQLSYAQKDSLSTPLINGHRFVLNELISNPFMYTSFSLNMGYGVSDGYAFPTFELGGREITIQSGELLFASLHTSYAQQINEWSMAFINIGFTGRLGTDPASMLSQGINSITGLSYGMRFKLWQGQKGMLSTEFQIRNYSIAYVNLFRYIRDLIEDDPSASLAQNNNSLAGNISLNYAYALNDMIGFYGNVKYFLGDNFIRGETINALNFSGAIDLNFLNRTKIPLGINLGFSSSTVPEYTLAREITSTIYTLQLTYVGREDLQIGIHSSFFNTPLEVEELPITRGLETNVSNLSVVMRYFF